MTRIIHHKFGSSYYVSDFFSGFGCSTESILQYFINDKIPIRDDMFLRIISNGAEKGNELPSILKYRLTYHINHYSRII